ncbi:MAG: RluA family pseudouridine synthase [Clostridia bacterium]|nr:RluA family pseudouridine synthase [Clostridia bacterium]
MRVLEFISNKNTDINHVLREQFELTSGFITKIKYNGLILLNGKESKVVSEVFPGDIIKILCPSSQINSIEPIEGELDVLYEDEDVLCINKLSGMPTHPSQNHHSDTLANIAVKYLREKDCELHIVTRLDRLTSGIVLIAKNAFSASKMCTKEYNSTIDKEYIGVCKGIFYNKSGTIDAPIGRHEDSIIKRCISEKGKYSKTGYKVLEEINGNSVVKFKLYTGRTHQIRVHCENISHPLLNDFLYDSDSNSQKSFKLHCSKIIFTHPFTKEKKTVTADLPQRFLEDIN